MKHFIRTLIWTVVIVSNSMVLYHRFIENNTWIRAISATTNILFLQNENSYAIWVYAIIFSLWVTWQMRKDEEKENIKMSRPIYCSKCDQYLGVAANFQGECNRCGSNRWRF